MPGTYTPAYHHFLDHLQHHKRYSPHTVTAYTQDLESFFDFLQREYDVADAATAKPQMVKSWLASLMEKGYTAKSVNRKISALRSFYKFLIRSGSLTSSPMELITAPKVKKKLPAFVEESDIKNLFSAVDFPEGIEGSTARIILQLLYNTGMRRAELIGLKWSDADRSNGTIKVLGKGSKERLIPVSRELLDAIDAYKPEKEAAGYAPSSWILTKPDGSRMDARKLYAIVKKYLSQVTTISKKSPHILRHSFATHLMNNGAEINAVKELLGHSSLAATQVYTHTSIEKLKEVFKQAHPKA